MLFWIICLLLTLCVAMIVVMPMLREGQGETASPDVAVYKAQLAEVDRDVAREVLAPSDAESARVEIARRLLAAQKLQQVTTDATGSKPVAFGVVAVIVALSGWLYWDMGAPGYPDLPLQTRIANGDAARADRPTQAMGEAAAPEIIPVEIPTELAAPIAQLRALMPARPNDLEGWTLLARYEAGLQNYSAAAAAQARVVAIKGEDATVTDLITHVDLLVAATNGYISPEAEAVTRVILARDDGNIAGRYYIAAMFDQTDRPDIAFRIWRELIASAQGQSFHVALARSQIESAAFRAGVDYSLPPEVGPSAAQIADAQDMAPEDRQAMIENMVATLADRLANEGGSAAEWARLISAYGVLGDTETARMIWVEAVDVFGASEDALTTLRAAASGAGVLE